MDKISNVLKSFFCNSKGFQPVYFWITLMMIFVVAALVMRLSGFFHHIDNTLVLGLCGFVATWAGLYNFSNVKRDGGEE